jgi:hypothetical protein
MAWQHPTAISAISNWEFGTDLVSDLKAVVDYMIQETAEGL